MATLTDNGSEAPARLGDVLRATAARVPDAPALRDGGQIIDYRSLWESVQSRADALRSAGLCEGDRVGIAAAREAATVVWMLAALEAGLRYLPLDPAFPDSRLRDMLEDGEVRAVVGAGAALDDLGRRLGPLPGLHAPREPAAVHAGGTGAGYVLFTSGSTGRPKGVSMGEAPLLELIRWQAADARLGRPAPTLQFAPLSFDVHLQEILGSVATGGCLVLVGEAVRRDPARLLAWMRDAGVERIFLPYVALQLLADAAVGQPLPPLRDIISAGEQLQVTPAIAHLCERLPGVALHNHYGPTESHVVTSHRLQGPTDTWPALVPIGRALPHVRLRLRTPAGDVEPVPGQEGELLIGGGALADGYLGRPALTAERFADADGGRWYATGDQVACDAAGLLVCRGRVDDEIKLDGYRIEPAEIEAVLRRQGGVREAVVDARDLGAAGRQLVAWIHPVPEVAFETLLPALRGACQRQLPAWMRPMRYVAVDRLPTTPSGKLDRRALALVDAPEPGEAAPAEVDAGPRPRIRSLWRSLLGQPTLGDEDNLFDAGARSVTVLQFIQQGREAGIRGLDVAMVYDQPSIAGITAALTTALEGPAPGGALAPQREDIAIIGMAVRCADAPDLLTFWKNLLQNHESISFFSKDEVDRSIPASVRERPNFVAARGLVADADAFDAGFFGVGPRESILIDPQQRLLLELAWTTFEHAGVRPDAGRRIGVFAGTANNTYAEAMREQAPGFIERTGSFPTMLGAEKDYVATRIAHLLNLRGPAISVHTACSTGLVAIGQACEALQSGRCEMALAGGATLVFPQAGGYLHVEGGMESADGHCRPFDAQATGTVFSSGAGMVLLKPLSAALADGDTVHAVIRGVGLNNDGGGKASFTAPSAYGQSGAVRMALDHAGVPASAIGMVEAHGTGTALGDPIEVAGLNRAWRRDTDAVGFARLGSIKGHLGHTIAAAGVLGLIKCALALREEVIPGTLHYREPNPKLGLDGSPFTISADAEPWPRGDAPRHAAVSSFGVGGTNAHVVLAEGPSPVAADDVHGPVLVPLSARSREALQSRAADLAAWLAARPDVALGPVVRTLVHGREPMRWRVAIDAANAGEAARALAGATQPLEALASPRVVFLLPGQGSQHPGMAAGPAALSSVFAGALDQAIDAVAPHLDVDLRTLLLEPGDEASAQALNQTCNAQPALLCMGWAMAAWLRSLGVEPAALVGHSIGELTAACIAGALTLDDAARVVCARGRAMQACRTGSMLAVQSPLGELSPMLPEAVVPAGINAPGLTVVAGPDQAIEALASLLAPRDVGCTRLRVSHAFHSPSMEPAIAPVEAALAGARMGAPGVPVHACVHGRAHTAESIADPAYWGRQLREPVRFSDSIQAELEPGTVFLELGPGQALTALVRQHRDPEGTAPRVVPMLPPPGRALDAGRHALRAVGQLWQHGVGIDWQISRRGPRADLPTYPFQRVRCWFTPEAGTATTPAAAPTHTSQQVAPSGPQENTVQDRKPLIADTLTHLFSEVAGLPEGSLRPADGLVEQGLDSLSLTQATLEIERVFGVHLKFRRLMEDLASVEALTVLLDQTLPAEKFAPTPAPGIVPDPAPPATAPSAPESPRPLSAPAVATRPDTPVGDGLAALLSQQLDLMQQQLALLGQAGATPAAPQAAAQATAPVPAVAAPAVPAAATDTGPEAAAPDLRAQPFGASARVTVRANRELDDRQRAWLDRFIVDYNARTAGSKAFSQQHRARMADPRVVTGFNPQWKDLVYPIVADRSEGATVTDIDGNRYIDLLSCFGANLLGYQPPGVMAAMREQLERGIEVGPQHPLAAEVAERIARLTGHARVGFCNTGSEAVMGAMRIARTVTGRRTIAIFTDSYHGIFDEVIVRGTRQLRSISAAPGILASAVENVLVLDYASEDSLRVLRERAGELAAIMIEPVQNKRPTLQPRAFVEALRAICDSAGCALIFDEVVTGFRLAPGGAQDFYGVRADLCTYGKIIGGGLPFAAIAGAPRWMDALDGGDWRYGDDSWPEAGVTYFAGTFVRHPLALAAANATLAHLEQEGPALQQRLNQRTQGLVDRLNAAFQTRDAPVRAVHCASLWRLAWEGDQPFVGLFYYLARHRGLHVYEQFGHFVTDAMGPGEIDRIHEVYVGALDEMMSLGLVQRRDGAPWQPPAATPVVEPAAATAAPAGPLAPGQTERWLMAGYDRAARIALNESICLLLPAGVDRGALAAALSDVVDRHHAFRVAFDEDSPRQQVSPAPAPAVQSVDLGAQPDPEQALEAFCTSAGARDFDLARAPMAAISLVELGDGRTAVHVVASHLVFDGWAASVFVHELGVALQARLQGHTPNLPPAVSPLDFAERLTQRFQGTEGRAAVAHWRRLNGDVPAPLPLEDLQAPARREFRAGTERGRVPGEVLAALRRRLGASGATLFHGLFAIVSEVLLERAGVDRALLGVPYAGQALTGDAAVVADGVLDLPLLADRLPGEDRDSRLARLKQRCMDAFEQPLLTQGAIARDLGLSASGNRAALTSVFFNLNPRVALAHFPLQPVALFEGRKHATLHGLFFNFHDLGDALSLDLHYGAELYSAGRARELVDAVIAACGSWADLPDPDGGASDDADEDTTGPGLGPTRALDPTARVERWIAEQSLLSPDAIAVVAADGQLDYRGLEQRANRIAHALRERGAGPGTFVGLCLERGIDLVPALLGVLKTGAAYVPLDPDFPLQRLRHMVEDAGLATLLSRQSLAEGLGVPGEACLLLDRDAALIDAQPDTTPPLEVDADAPAYVIYTSGSTGQPKGVVVLQRGVCNFLQSMARTPGLAIGDRLLAVTTLSFDIAVLELLLPLCVGARTVLATREAAVDGTSLAALVERHGITVLQATPTTWHLLLAAGFRAPEGFRALCGGEALAPALASGLLEAGAQLWNMYGPTETTVWSTTEPITDAAAPITVGRPIDNTRVRILDTSLAPCTGSEPGEICIGGAGVARGYHRREALTAERFIADPLAPGERLYRTGDLGRWGSDGRIIHMGRLDHQVKLRGYRIELGEIEAALEDLPGIARAVCGVRTFSGPTDQRMVAWVVPAGGPAPDLPTLRRALAGRLPDYMLPQALVALGSLPLLPNGKVDRHALPDPGKAPAPTPVESEAPEATPAGDDGVAQWLATTMGELIGLPALGPGDSFFAHGGHSLLAAQLVARVRERTGRRLDLRAVFENPTPAALSRMLAEPSPAAAQAQPPAAPEPVAGAPGEPAPMSLMQQRLWYQEQLDPGGSSGNLPSGHRLRGHLDIEALEWALGEIVRRQDSLRTVFSQRGSELRQHVQPPAPVALRPLVDCSDRPLHEAEAAVAASIDDLARQAFDLTGGPLYCHRLYRLAPDHHVLFFMVHHLVWDGWSFDLWYAELSELYRSRCSGRVPELPALPLRYADFARWQLQRLDEAELQRQSRHWAQRLLPLPEPLALPADHPRPDTFSGRGASHYLRLPQATLDAVHQTARSAGTTAFIVLLTAWADTLSALSGQTDLVIATPVRGRDQPAFEHLMGFFVNALSLRLDLSAGGDTGERLQRHHRAMADALACPEVAIEHLIRMLKLPHDPSRPALAQNLFSFQDVRDRVTRWGNLEHARFDVPMYGTRHEISLWCVETPIGLECVLTYASDLFEPATVERFAQRFAESIAALVEVRPVTEASVRLPGPGALSDVAVDVAPDPVHASGTTGQAGPETAGRPDTAHATTDARVALVLGIARELIGQGDIDPDHNFFEVGGHSLLALQLIGRIEEATGVRPSLLSLARGSLRMVAGELPVPDGTAPVRRKGLGSRLRRLFGRTAEAGR